MSLLTTVVFECPQGWLPEPRQPWEKCREKKVLSTKRPNPSGTELTCDVEDVVGDASRCHGALGGFPLQDGHHGLQLVQGPCQAGLANQFLAHHLQKGTQSEAVGTSPWKDEGKCSSSDLQRLEHVCSNTICTLKVSFQPQGGDCRGNGCSAHTERCYHQQC